MKTTYLQTKERDAEENPLILFDQLQDEYR
jgi:hypothetical protein